MKLVSRVLAVAIVMLLVSCDCKDYPDQTHSHGSELKKKPARLMIWAGLESHNLMQYCMVGWEYYGDRRIRIQNGKGS